MIAILYQVECDTCPDYSNFRSTKEKAVAIAEEYGWVVHGDGHALCPTCADALMKPQLYKRIALKDEKDLPRARRGRWVLKPLPR